MIIAAMFGVGEKITEQMTNILCMPPCSYFITTAGITKPSWHFPTDLRDPTQHSVLTTANQAEQTGEW